MVIMMTIKEINPSDGIVPIARFKAHASRLIRKLRGDGRPIVITQNGEAAAVLVTPQDYERLRGRTPSYASSVNESGATYGSPPALDGLPVKRIRTIARRHGASRIRVFGSVARGESGNDLDLLVEMSRDRSLLDLIGLEQELSDLLEARVDVVTEEGLPSSLLETILSEAVDL